VIIKILKNWNVDEEMLSALQHQDEDSNAPRED
jgi:HD-like signal output (HDOD) protein